MIIQPLPDEDEAKLLPGSQALMTAAVENELFSGLDVDSNRGKISNRPKADSR
jgi:hypothetical protein